MSSATGVTLLTQRGATRNAQRSESRFAQGDERLHAFTHQSNHEGEGTPLAHPRAMSIATNASNTKQVPTDAAATTVVKREELVGAETKQSEAEPEDLANETYTLACTD
jgi:hypothetical protein